MEAKDLKLIQSFLVMSHVLRKTPDLRNLKLAKASKIL